MLEVDRKQLKRITKVSDKVFYAYKPLQRLLPNLTKADIEDLREVLKMEGLTKPLRVVLFSDKKVKRYVVLDGVHRVQIAVELGLDLELEEVQVRNEEELVELGLKLNLQEKRGRQISKRQLVKRLRKVHSDLSFEEFCVVLKEKYGLQLSKETISKYVYLKQRGQVKSSEQKCRIKRLAQELGCKPKELAETVCTLVRTVHQVAGPQWKTMLMQLSNPELIRVVSTVVQS
ncbi:ParB N-terminal domain-containing protein [bacterium]|nr:ParB N-terminal domain-containing protein [bacterium]